VSRVVALVILSVVFVVAGVAIFLLLSATVTLECARPEAGRGRCALTTAGPLGTDMIEILLSEVQRAEVEASASSDGDDTYRVVLQTERGPVPLTSYFSSGRDDKQARADQINAFLRDPAARSLSVTQDDRWFGYLLGGLFTTLGCLAGFGGLFAPLLAFGRRLTTLP
jgi:hypothetical protein